MRVAGGGHPTNILIGVLAYTYNNASATDTQTTQITLDSRAGTLSPVFVYQLDGVKKLIVFSVRGRATWRSARR